MQKKYELTSERNAQGLFRIRALTSFSIGFRTIKKGELGGFIEKEENLSQEGLAWVCDSAKVYGSAKVSGEAQVIGSAKVSGEAIVYGSAQVGGEAIVYGSARVYGKAIVYGSARVYGKAKVSGEAIVSGEAWVYGSAKVYGSAWVYGKAKVRQKDKISKPSDLINISCGVKYGLTITKTAVRAGCKDFTHKQFKAVKLSYAKEYGFETLEQLNAYKAWLTVFEMTQKAEREGK